MVKRINVSLTEDTLKIIDDFTERTGMSRSQLFNVATRHYIDAQNKIPSLLDQLDELKKYLPAWSDGINEVKNKVIEVQGK